MKGSVAFFLRIIGGRGLGAAWLEAAWLGAYIDKKSVSVINNKVSQEHDAYICSRSRWRRPYRVIFGRISLAIARRLDETLRNRQHV